jgi:hypothetical protein
MFERQYGPTNTGTIAMIKLHSIIATVVLALVPVFASAETSEPITFSYAGEIYTYTVEQIGEKKVLRGDIGARHEPFVLNVGKSWVSGMVNGNEVSFSRSSVKHRKGIVTVEQLASR